MDARTTTALLYLDGVTVSFDGFRALNNLSFTIEPGEMRAIIGSRFGKALTAVRDAESRMRFLGYRVERFKLFVFVLSAAMAGIAGALYVPQVGIINPGEFAPGNSIEAVLWVAVGGRGTLIGPVIGAFIVNFGKTYLTGALPEFWLFALGALFIVVTLLLPKGVVGLWNQFTSRSRERKARATA